MMAKMMLVVDFIWWLLFLFLVSVIVSGVAVVACDGDLYVG